MREFIAVDLPADELADRLTMVGLEVEEVVRFGDELRDMRVGQIKTREKHPNADKLTLCTVSDGERDLQVVCGATNHQAGDKVALAYPGQRFLSLKTGEETKLTRAKIRGVESEAMMCSEVEVGLGEQASGIMILPPETPVGASFVEAMGLADAVFDIAVMPNRPDVASVIGVAREVAALLDLPMHDPDCSVEELGDRPTEQWAKIEIADADLCARYVGRVIDGVTIAPSPLWVRQRLMKVGVRAISNIVDVTNLVMMELGQPLHAFDYRRIAKGHIIVRRARAGEKMTTLDGQERVLDDQMLLITDPNGPIALAGVMGGANTEIEPDTTTILLESAWFEPGCIRRTSRRLGLPSESSYRFERGVDPQLQAKAAARAAKLMVELGGGRVMPGALDVVAKQAAPRRVKVRTPRVNLVLGTALSQGEVETMLKRMQLPVVESRQNETVVENPSYRVDLDREIDYIEELARLYGYDHIPTPVSSTKIVAHETSIGERLESATRNVLTGFGFYEIINCNLISDKTASAVGELFFDTPVQPVRVLQAKSADLVNLRATLLTGMLETLARNHRQRRPDLELFEIGQVHLPGDGGRPVERAMLSLGLSGRCDDEGWDVRPPEVDFFDLKGTIEGHLKALGVETVTFTASSNRLLMPGQCASVSVEGTVLGLCGRLSSAAAQAFELDAAAYVAEFDLEALASVAQFKGRYEPLPVYPGTRRDVALVVPEATPYEAVRQAIDSVEVPILRDYRLFDLYRGEQVGGGRKSLALAFEYRSDMGTLTDKQVEKAHAQIKKALIDHLECEIRES
ncbi:MAG: phenylalanine--tRNA ligase subunit beta [Verrucomicrobia bacterium]|nr:phenylalanine--tRNA ligase subunit beta [Verrucomicrobiota bacterium]